MYSVGRVENKADNPYIRVKMVGGENIGLSMRFSTFDNDITIHDFKLMTNFSQNRYVNAGLAWSSALYKLPEIKKAHKNKICQNI